MERIEGYETTVDLLIERCIRHTDGSIVHANDVFAGTGERHRVYVCNDRPMCERLSDGSIAHVPSKTPMAS